MMEWILRSPQVHSTFGNLGFKHANGYAIDENCNSALETILDGILTEDKFLRTYRRGINFGQNMNKDIIPLLIHAKDDKTIELLIRILTNLTIPVECLLSVDVISRTDIGRHTVFEINNLLTSTKVAFTDPRVTKVVIEFLKKNLDEENSDKLSPEQCDNINDILLLLRNILNIPGHSLQNQIIWNIFSQRIDKVLIKLMNIPESSNWCVSMVQLIALLYKDQDVGTMQKLLNKWMDATLSESSEDNESNTSSPNGGSGYSSPMLTSEPTDSLDNGGSSNCSKSNSGSEEWFLKFKEAAPQRPGSTAAAAAAPAPSAPANTASTDTSNSFPGKSDDDMMMMTCSNSMEPESPSKTTGPGTMAVVCKLRDRGYETQLENQGSASSSCNENEVSSKKPVRQKPRNLKQRGAKKPAHRKLRGGKARRGALASPQDKKRRKIFKQAKAKIIDVQGLMHKMPKDEDISKIINDFTVYFLLQGYNGLVLMVHTQILTNRQLEIDTSHFMWLVTYFLKFATQIELELESVRAALSADMLGYLAAEGAAQCEQLDLAIARGGVDLTPPVRRLHLVVTAIREFVQALEVYWKASGGGVGEGGEAGAQLARLRLEAAAAHELRALPVLLLRHYNPKYQSKQYLQDIVVTNHVLLLFVDSVMKTPQYNGPNDMEEHLKLFTSPKIMQKYGNLLEDYRDNGEFVNDCIFTMMHHVSGSLDSLSSLFQANILKSFQSIWETEFEICDDWSDIIQYTINTIVSKPQPLRREPGERRPVPACAPAAAPASTSTSSAADSVSAPAAAPVPSEGEQWTDKELSTLNWNYLQCNTAADFIGDIVRMFNDHGVIKSRYSVITELYRQSIIDKEEIDKLLILESDKSFKTLPMTKETRDQEIGELCKLLIQDGKQEFLQWVQNVLLDVCFVRIYLDKKALYAQPEKQQQRLELLKKKSNSISIMLPTAYHCLLVGAGVPLVAWSCAQAGAARDLRVLQLLHRLGLALPGDTGKLFVRVPHFWTSDTLYETAGKILPIDTTKLKFTMKDITSSGAVGSQVSATPAAAATATAAAAAATAAAAAATAAAATTAAATAGALTAAAGPLGNLYHVLEHNHPGTMLNFTPRPSWSSAESPRVAQNKMNWLEVVQWSQEVKISLSELPAGRARAPPLAGESPLPDSDLTSVYDDTASMASDLTRMYVSDEDENMKVEPGSAPAGDTPGPAEDAPPPAAATPPSDAAAPPPDAAAARPDPPCEGCSANKRRRLQ